MPAAKTSKLRILAEFCFQSEPKREKVTVAKFGKTGGDSQRGYFPALDLERLLAAWRETVFALYLAEDKIEPEVVENMPSWPHSGFGVDQSVFLAAGDKPGIERLVQYMTRCPFSLSPINSP
jgi:hypothetical protein